MSRVYLLDYACQDFGTQKTGLLQRIGEKGVSEHFWKLHAKPEVGRFSCHLFPSCFLEAAKLPRLDQCVQLRAHIRDSDNLCSKRCSKLRST